jgi:hypothetical protein
MAANTANPAASNIRFMALMYKEVRGQNATFMYLLSLVCRNPANLGEIIYQLL